MADRFTAWDPRLLSIVCTIHVTPTRATMVASMAAAVLDSTLHKAGRINLLLHLLEKLAKLRGQKTWGKEGLTTLVTGNLASGGTNLDQGFSYECLLTLLAKKKNQPS